MQIYKIYKYKNPKIAKIQNMNYGTYTKYKMKVRDFDLL